MENEKIIIKEDNIDEKNESISDEQLPDESKVQIEDVVDSFKETAGMAVDLIGDAAKDVGVFAGEQLKNARNIFDKVGRNLGESRSRQRLEKYNPVFLEDIKSDEFVYPRMIGVIDTDKRKNIEELQNAIGFLQKEKSLDYLEIYRENINELDLIFYPNRNCEAYYVHPLQKNLYIDVTKYFNYLKEARVSELKYIAQALGATYFRVAIMEESLTENNSTTKGESMLGFAKNKLGVKVERSTQNKEYVQASIEAESKYTGKAPVRPELKLWANSEAIKSLVEQRLSPDNPLVSETYRLDYNTSTGIREKEAASIDGVLKGLKFKGAGSILEEAKKESKKSFEYKIEF